MERGKVQHCIVCHCQQLGHAATMSTMGMGMQPNYASPDHYMASHWSQMTWQYIMMLIKLLCVRDNAE